MIKYLLALYHAWVLRRRYPERTQPMSKLWPDYMERFDKRRELERERRVRALVQRMRASGNDGTELPVEKPDPQFMGEGREIEDIDL